MLRLGVVLVARFRVLILISLQAIGEQMINSAIISLPM